MARSRVSSLRDLAGIGDDQSQGGSDHHVDEHNDANDVNDA